MSVPAALLFLPDQSLADHVELLLDEVPVVSVRVVSAGEASRLINEVVPDVLLLDLDRAPGETGRLLCALSPVFGSTPVIWFTHGAETAAWDRVRKTGAQGVLRKDSEPLTVVRTIVRVLQGETSYPGINTLPATPCAKGIGESERLLQMLTKTPG